MRNLECSDHGWHPELQRSAGRQQRRQSQLARDLPSGHATGTADAQLCAADRIDDQLSAPQRHCRQHRDGSDPRHPQRRLAGSGPNVTTKVETCALSNETIPGTFAGFNTTLTFVGNTTTPQNLNLTALVLTTAVTTKLDNCALPNETIPGTFGGFNTTLNFVGNTSTPQNLSLTAVVRATTSNGK